MTLCLERASRLPTCSWGRSSAHRRPLLLETAISPCFHLPASLQGPLECYVFAVFSSPCCGPRGRPLFVRSPWGLREHSCQYVRHSGQPRSIAIIHTNIHNWISTQIPLVVPSFPSSASPLPVTFASPTCPCFHSICSPPKAPAGSCSRWAQLRHRGPAAAVKGSPQTWEVARCDGGHRDTREFKALSLPSRALSGPVA